MTVKWFPLSVLVVLASSHRVDAQAAGLPVLPRVTIGSAVEIFGGAATGGPIADTAVTMGASGILAFGDWAVTGMVSRFDTPGPDGHVLSYGGLLNWRSLQLGFGHTAVNGISDVRVPLSIRFLIFGCLNRGTSWQLSAAPRAEMVVTGGDAKWAGGVTGQFAFEWRNGFGFRVVGDGMGVQDEDDPRLVLALSVFYAFTSWVEHGEQEEDPNRAGCVSLLGRMH